VSTVEELAFTRCTTHAGLSALISTRCYPDRVPEDPTYPLVRYTRISTATFGLRQMARNSNTPLARVRVQFDAFGETGDDARGVAEQLFAAWDGYQSSGGGGDIGYAFQDNRASLRDDALNAYRQIVDVIMLVAI
jgi:hypothetical protein